MDISTLEWVLTIGIMSAVIIFDVIVITRNPHEPTIKECTLALSAYIGAAILFGAWIWYDHGSELGIQFYAGWLT